MNAGGCCNAFRLIELIGGFVEGEAVPPVPVTGVEIDSARIRPGGVFFALRGTRCHGMVYAAEAIAKGAAAIVYDPEGEGMALAAPVAGRIPTVPMAGLAQKVGYIADRFYGHPSAYIDTIGITGTNGKTSCSHFLARAMDRCAVLGTLGWGYGKRLNPVTHTTPDAIAVHAALARLRSRGAAAVAMEVSSHGQAQGRVNGVRFKGALYTNISRDHLDYHGNMDAYIEAKLRLLQAPSLDFVALNLDDRYAERVLGGAAADVRVFGFTRFAENVAAKGSRQDGVALVCASGLRMDPSGISFEISFQSENACVSAPVFGDFNVDNLLGTLTVLLALGFSLDEAAGRLGRVQAVPGRMERFVRGSEAPVVLVDYAHTPQALRRALQSLRPFCRGRLWVVFGCGGERDRGKRPQMARVAERWADRIIVTDDNPRGEDGDGIVADIFSGFRSKRPQVVRERERAIHLAIESAAADDWVLVAGKGHEETQEIAGVQHPFSDRSVVRSALMAR